MQTKLGKGLLALWLLIGVVQASERILVLGDSHSALVFGRELHKQLSIEENKVWISAVCGSHPSWWYKRTKTFCGYQFIKPDGKRRTHRTDGWSIKKTPHIYEVLKEADPTVMIVPLGANLINYKPKGTEKIIRNFIQDMQKRIPEMRIIWVGPPRGRNKPEPKFSNLYKAIKNAIGKRVPLIDSRIEVMVDGELKSLDADSFGRGDGRHFDTAGKAGKDMARAWAQHVAEESLLIMNRIDLVM